MTVGACCLLFQPARQSKLHDIWARAGPRKSCWDDGWIPWTMRPGMCSRFPFTATWQTSAFRRESRYITKLYRRQTASEFPPFVTRLVPSKGDTSSSSTLQLQARKPFFLGGPVLLACFASTQGEAGATIETHQAKYPISELESNRVDSCFGRRCILASCYLSRLLVVALSCSHLQTYADM